MRSAFLIIISLLTLSPAAARADRRDVYLTLTLEPQLSGFTEPTGRVATATNLGGGASVSALYGLTNTFHAGADVHFALSRNVAFGNAPMNQDGFSTPGTIYEDLYAYGANAVLAWRFATGHDIAPVARGEVGFAEIACSNITATPAGGGYTLSVPSAHEFVLELRGALLTEYRISNHLVAAAGFAFTHHSGRLSTWDFSIPFTFGWIW